MDRVGHVMVILILSFLEIYSAGYSTECTQCIMTVNNEFERLTIHGNNTKLCSINRDFLKCSMDNRCTEGEQGYDFVVMEDDIRKLIASACCCGGDLVGDVGSFASPGYPMNYPNNIRCTWRIHVPEGKVVELSFEDFDLEQEPSCKWDYVSVFDGDDENNSQLGRFCGGFARNITSTSNTILVVFSSDGVVSASGFYAHWTSVTAPNNTCGGQLSGDMGNFTTPGYPQNLGNDITCDWTITVPEGKVIHLTFQIFDFVWFSSSCKYRVLSIYDVTFDKVLDGFCGGSRLNVISQGHIVRVTLPTDHPYTRPGFLAHWNSSTQTAPNNTCGGQLSGDIGNFTTPGYPLNLGNDVTCDWTITVPEGKFINLIFPIGPSEWVPSSCKNKVLTIYDVTKDEVLGDSCGGSSFSVISLGNIVRVTLMNDGSLPRPGFLAHWMSVTPDDDFMQ